MSLSCLNESVAFCGTVSDNTRTFLSRYFLYKTVVMRYSKEFINGYLLDVMEQLFDIERDSIKPESRLYEDLGLDSIDAVDLTVKLKEFTGRKHTPTDFKDVRTVHDVTEAVFALLNDENPDTPDEQQSETHS